MSGLNALVSDYLALVIVALVAFLAAALLLAWRAGRRAARLERRLAAVTRGSDGRDLGAVLEAHVEKVYSVSRRQDQLERHVASLDAQAGRSVQGVGLVRFNNFEDTGGNQSFAIAFIDPSGTGVVVSSLHARNQTRIYAKGVSGGATEGALSEEEAAAVRLAGNRALGR